MWAGKDQNNMKVEDMMVTEDSPIRAIIFGRAGTGKTRGAMTFPNPVIMNFDNNLPKGTPGIPCWNEEFLKKFKPMPMTIADMYRQISSQLAPDQTLIIDSLTSVERKFDTWEKTNPIYTKRTMEPDGFSMFRRRLDFWNEIFELWRQSKHNLVVLMHQINEKNDKGEETQNVKPLLSGKAGDVVITIANCIMQAGITQHGKFVWRVKPNNYVPARLWTPNPVSQEFINQEYAELANILA
jgi:hypothetical protein